MPETWQPPPRELFEGRYDSERFNSAKERYVRLLEEVRRDVRTPERLGASLGKGLVRIFDAAGGQLSPAQTRLAQNMLREVQPKASEVVLSGFMAEYAAAATFTKLDFPTYYPLLEEDLHNAVDWWIDLSDVDAGTLALQVKSVALRPNVSNKLLYKVNSQNDLESLLATLFRPENLSIANKEGANELAYRIKGKLRQAWYKLARLRERYRNAEVGFLLLDNMYSDRPRFNSLTGQPTEQTVNLILNGLEQWQEGGRD